MFFFSVTFVNSENEQNENGNETDRYEDRVIQKKNWLRMNSNAISIETLIEHWITIDLKHGQTIFFLYVFEVFAKYFFRRS